MADRCTRLLRSSGRDTPYNRFSEKYQAATTNISIGLREVARPGGCREVRLQRQRELPEKLNEKDHNKHKHEQLRVSEGVKSSTGVSKAESKSSIL